MEPSPRAGIYCQCIQSCRHNDESSSSVVLRYHKLNPASLSRPYRSLYSYYQRSITWCDHVYLPQKDFVTCVHNCISVGHQHATGAWISNFGAGSQMSLSPYWKGSRNSVPEIFTVPQKLNSQTDYHRKLTFPWLS